MSVADSTPEPAPVLAQQLDRFLAGPMFFLSLVYLAVAAGIIHRLGDGYFVQIEAEVMLWCLAGLSPIFIVEAWLRFFLTRTQMSFWPRLGILLLVHVVPFVRMGLRAHADAGKLWLPWLGWQPVDRLLRRSLERFFSVPLILFALMVLPVLALEHFWEELVHEHFWLKLTLDIASSLIWMAFAIEFTLSVSIAEKKLLYCIQNWIDLAVVALPVVDFLPALRLWQLARLVQLNQLGKLGRLYRLRGLMLKAWRAFLFLEMIHRLLGNYKQRRLKSLRDQVAAREIELAELRQEIAELEQAILKETEVPAAPPAEVIAERERVE
jgi:hypothetical protein